MELTNNCNCNCSHCIRDKGIKYLEKKGNIEKRIVINLIDDLVNNAIKFYDFNMFWLGEPLMHPDFLEIYSYVLNANKKNKLFGSVNIHTNAHFLSQEIINLLNEFHDVPQTWHLTIDATSPITYQKISGTHGFEKVVENCKQLLSQKEGKFPRIVFQFIVEEENYYEAEPFINFWSKEFEKYKLSFSKVGYFVPGYVDNFIFLRQCDAVTGGEERQKKLNTLYKNTLLENGIQDHNYEGKEAVFIPEGYVHIPYKKRKKLGEVDFSKNSICSGFWKTPTISWTGEVTVCQRDSGMELKAGDLKKEKFSEIWWESKQMKKNRNAMIEQDLEKIPICNGCLIPKSSNYSSISENELEYYFLKNEEH